MKISFELPQIVGVDDYDKFAIIEEMFTKFGLKSKVKIKIRRTLNKIMDSDLVIELACDLYSRITGMVTISDKIKIFTCGWIAYKLVDRKSISLIVLPFELHEILQSERIICNYLSYRLYCKPSQIIFQKIKR